MSLRQENYQAKNIAGIAPRDREREREKRERTYHPIKMMLSETKTLAEKAVVTVYIFTEGVEL